MGAKLPDLNVAETVAPKLERLLASAELLGLKIGRGALGETLVDAAAANLAAGVEIAAICMGGLGRVRLRVGGDSWPLGPLTVEVGSYHPVLACLASQYAGWKLAEGDFFALASGPGRAQAAAEELFTELGYKVEAKRAVLVLETETPPPPAVVKKVAARCGLKPRNLVFITTPTTSLAGGVQIIGRVLEVALHKAHELGFKLENIVDGGGVAPLAPPSPDFVTAMGRTNDAVIYGGSVQLLVNGADGDAERLARQLPSSASKDYGTPFAETFRRFKGDFYAIDPKLFSPARVMVTAMESGNSFVGGRVNREVLSASFAIKRCD